MTPNKKQIEANLRNKMAKVRDEKMERLEQRYDQLARDYNQMHIRAAKAEQERDNLQEEVKQLKDWIERLHEYMGMNDHDREIYVENLRQEAAVQEAMNQVEYQLEGIGWIQHMLGFVH